MLAGRWRESAVASYTPSMQIALPGHPLLKRALRKSCRASEPLVSAADQPGVLWDPFRSERPQA